MHPEAYCPSKSTPGTLPQGGKHGLATIVDVNLTSASEPQPAVALFQSDVLDESCASIVEIIAEVLDLFMKQGPADIDRIVAALAGGDLRQARDAAHCLKGACLSIGAEALAAACQQIESLDDNASVSVAATRDDLSLKWSLLRDAITSYRQTIDLISVAS
jgi:HPt (histidine-containing phosphotransfer) domain-containing protein